MKENGANGPFISRLTLKSKRAAIEKKTQKIFSKFYYRSPTKVVGR